MCQELALLAVSAQESGKDPESHWKPGMVPTQKLGPDCQAGALAQMSGHLGYEGKKGRTLWLVHRLCG